jgi:hypothetical protein
MKPKGLVLAILVLAIGILVAGAAVVSRDSTPEGQRNLNPAEHKNPNQKLAEVGARVPQFGGMFMSEDQQTLNVYYVGQLNEGTAQELEQSIVSTYGAKRIPPSGIRLIPADYSITQLTEWYTLMRQEVKSLPGVTSTGIDESGNRISVGVRNNEARDAIEGDLAKLLSNLGVPREAVNLKLFGLVRAFTHERLDEEVSLPAAGVQVQVTGLGECSVGFFTELNNVEGYVTAAHCTNPIFGVDGGGDQAYQAIAPTEEHIGTETIDPAVLNPDPAGCDPAPSNCVRSDSAFFELEDNIVVDRGYIFKPESEDSGDLDINGHFRITAEDPTVVNQEVLHKVGRTTGWSSYAVYDVCEDVLVDINGDETADYEVICAQLVESDAASSNEGDSGAPVFRITNDPTTNDVDLVGVLFGGMVDPETGQIIGYAFSDLGDVYLRLGGLFGTWDSCVGTMC